MPRSHSCFSSKAVIRPNGTAGWGVRRGERRSGRAMRSADPLPLNSRNAPPTAFAMPPGLRRIGENKPPSGWDSKLVVPVRECYRWSLHCSFLARHCCLSDRDTGTTCSRIRRCAQNHAGKHVERLRVHRGRYLAESAAFHAKRRFSSGIPCEWEHTATQVRPRRERL
jgi:hypothetical protein